LPAAFLTRKDYDEMKITLPFVSRKKIVNYILSRKLNAEDWMWIKSEPDEKERERDISRSEMWDKTLDTIAREIRQGEI
jgi:hypothetical protein